MCLLRYNDSIRLSAGTFEEHTEHLEGYRERMARVVAEQEWHAPQASLLAPSDDVAAQGTYAVADALKHDALEHVFLAGIGGSNLGTKAILDALGHHYATLATLRPHVHFLDTTDPSLLAHARTRIAALPAPESVAVIIISKSGGTTETLFNAEVVLAALRERFGEAATTRVAVVSEPDSALSREARERGFHTVAHPPEIGGRYSVFTAVGLLPLALVGIDVEALRAGAREARARGLEDSDRNDARASAVCLFAHYDRGLSIHDTFVFAPQLHSLGLWYRQLMGESVGKECDREGVVVHAGMTPTVSVGSTDLHSVGQLYLAGPRDKVTTFVSIAAPRDTVSTPEERVFPSLVPMINGHDAAEVTRAILEGTKAAYRAHERPYMELIVPQLDAHSLGQVLQLKMLEMMYLAELMQVNAFDQPNVESYKVETKRSLEGA